MPNLSLNKDVNVVNFFIITGFWKNSHTFTDTNGDKAQSVVETLSTDFSSSIFSKCVKCVLFMTR